MAQELVLELTYGGMAASLAKTFLGVTLEEFLSQKLGARQTSPWKDQKCQVAFPKATIWTLEHQGKNYLVVDWDGKTLFLDVQSAEFDGPVHRKGVFKPLTGGDVRPLRPQKGDYWEYKLPLASLRLQVIDCPQDGS